MVINKNGLLAIFITLIVGLAIVSAGEYYEINNIRNTNTNSSVIARVYEVTFVQATSCGPPGEWGIPWAVTLDNQTEVQPSNATLPVTTHTKNTTNQSLTMISFSVRNGTYDYDVAPNVPGPSPGMVTVDGSNVLVRLGWEAGCPYNPADG